METNNKLIAEFDGWSYIPNAKYKNDLYEAGDKEGSWETTDIFVLNPSKEFLKRKKFGIFAEEDYYDDKKPYDNCKWFLNYDKDWNLLIGVANKIGKIIKNNKAFDKWYLFQDYCLTDLDIKEVYKNIIQFIKWYNNEKS
tara:strand:- start:11 stop:430 length:420 start_codon:yes stop_codon:yes gene_type:complete